MAETRCDSRHQIAEMENKVYGIFDKTEETRRAICRQAEKILAEEKEKVAEVRSLATKKMAEKMVDIEENNAEMIRVTCLKMINMA